MAEQTPPVPFTLEEAQQLYDECRFNCGPGALCAVTGRRPVDVLEAMPDFRARGYTNPKMMRRALTALQAIWSEPLSEDGAVNLTPGAIFPKPSFGLVRVQWGGRWTKPGVPVRAR